MENYDAVKASVKITKTVQTTLWSTPDSGALDPVNGKSLSKSTEMDRPAEIRF